MVNGEKMGKNEFGIIDKLKNSLRSDITFGASSSKSASKQSKDVKGAADTETFVVDRTVGVKVTFGDTVDDYMNMYDREITISSTVNRMSNIIVRNINLVYNQEFDDVKLEQLKELGLNNFTVKRLISMSYINRMIYGYSFIRKEVPLVLATGGCKPIFNNKMGRLGVEGVDPEHSADLIALVQNVDNEKYNSDGSKMTLGTEDIYFTVDEVIGLPNIGRNDYDSKSPTARVKRMVELKQTFENILGIVFTRLGAQVSVTLGNKDMRFDKMKIPKKYMTEGVTPMDAKKAHNNAIRTGITTEINDWLNGESLAFIKDYGIDVDIHNASASLPQYNLYLNLFSSYIRAGLLDLFVQGRIDVTSSVMQQDVLRDMKDYAEMRIEEYVYLFNEEFIKPALISIGMKGDEIELVGKNVESEKDIAELERIKSMTISDYRKSGLVPQCVLDRLDIVMEDNEEGDMDEEEDNDKDDEDKDEEDEEGGDKDDSNDEGKDN